MEFAKYFKYALDIAIVASIIYTLYKLIAGTRTVQVLRGIIIMVIAYFIGKLLELNTFVWIYEKGLEVAAIALIVIFQHELRRIVMKLGENVPLFNNLFKQTEEEIMNIIPQAVYNMSKTRTGALIVVMRNTGLRAIIERGVQLDAILSSELIESIFVPKNPLHDGATIISDNRIVASACLLPLTERTDLSKIFGTRHRAAIGLSEETDAVIIVVSEENGKVSIAQEGKLYYDLKKEKFENTLRRFLFTVKESKQSGNGFNFGIWLKNQKGNSSKKKTDKKQTSEAELNKPEEKEAEKEVKNV